MDKREMLLALIDRYADGNKASMAKRLGVTPQAISTWLARNTFDNELIFAKCESLNAEWLLTGKGEMTKSVVPAAANNYTAVPVYNAEASAGEGLLRLGTEFVDQYLQLPYARKGDIALTAVGNSMLPVINSGDLLVVREKTNWNEFLEPGKMYVIVTNDEIYVKVISGITPDDSLQLHSYNADYPDFNVPSRFVQSVFRVVAVVSQRH